MSTLPPPQGPASPEPTGAAPKGPVYTGPNPVVRFGIGMMIGLLLLLILSGLHISATTGPLTRINLKATNVALGAATAAENLGHGVATQNDVLKAASKVHSMAVVHNLGQIPGDPRAVEYQFLSNGTWVKVCVEVPKGAYAPYPLVCPGV